MILGQLTMGARHAKNAPLHQIEAHFQIQERIGPTARNQASKQYRVQRPIQQFNRPTGDLEFSQNPISYKHQVIALPQSTISTFVDIGNSLLGFYWLTVMLLMAHPTKTHFLSQGPLPPPSKSPHPLA